ncbi:hypothetical protein FIU87_04675 [Bacillus sp. THAF10]|uniref:hypothetical protein n=1 Tax=Bacillus sp. THAF10 TaxID=2587848 RepID=UPI001267EF11|nr:hypothetical protein [Bacillus sp. THAF10]QFT87943.1 hypothetical protein FIU87_04675 [Bacillus sp. THAF10]
MKKLGFLTFFALLFFGVSLGVSSTAHASEGDIEKALQIIEKANIEMDEIIDAGVEEADAIWAVYLAEYDVMKAELEALSQQIQAVEASMENSSESAELAALSEQLASLQEEKSLLEEAMAQKTAKFDQEVDEIISYVFDITLEMTQDTIDEVAQYGVVAECYWKYVRFADRWAWIDPVRVVAT